MKSRRLLKGLAVAAAFAVAGVAGATYAASQDGDDKAAEAAVVPAALNPDLDVEATFVPVTPCRLLDTRATAAGRIAAGAQRGFDVTNADLSSQGGSASGCGIPTFATAVDINITAVEPTAKGFLRGAAQSTYTPPPPTR